MHEAVFCQRIRGRRSDADQVAESVGEVFAEALDEPLANELQVGLSRLPRDDRESIQPSNERVVIPVNGDEIDHLFDGT